MSSPRTDRTKAPATRSAARGKGIAVVGEIRCTARLCKPVVTGKPPTWSFISLPAEASKRLPSRGPVSVEGTLNDAPFAETLQPDGEGGHWLKVERSLREAAGATIGASVALSFVPSAEDPEPKVPPDFRRALASADPKATATWADITPAARRDWILWITSGKRAETRSIRIEKACDMLAKGKRRACCFDRTGMYDKSIRGPVADECSSSESCDEE